MSREEFDIRVKILTFKSSNTHISLYNIATRILDIKYMYNAITPNEYNDLCSYIHEKYE